MCGIFGYVGARATENLLLEGLKRLEYRGYDSWGISLGSQSMKKLHVKKESGRISAEMSDRKADEKINYWGGIAHTRWATHGAPTKVNAHPHLADKGKLALVHNGIIENHMPLRESLKSKGYVFESDTDTEVIGHLVADLMKEGLDYEHAFLGTLKLLEGTYGVVLIHSDHPDVILIGRKGSPMVIGVGEKETMVASDPSALVAYTRNVVYLEDGETAKITPDSFETRDLDDLPVSKEIERVAFDLPSIEKAGFASFMLKEIFEQPESIRNAFRGRIVRNEGTAKLGGIDEDILRRTKRCHIVACGTSWHAALVGKYMLENLARVPTEVSYAAEFRYANPVIQPDTLVVAISQSGETADTLAAVREAKIRGAWTVGMCNVVGSTIARECGQGVYLHAGPEIGVASTKAFTSQLVVLSLLAVYLGRLRDMSLADALYYLKALEEMPDLVQRALELDRQIEDIADHYSRSPNFLYIGRLYEYPVALEGALKLKEISYIHAEGIPAAELKHGPIALVDGKTPTVALAAGSIVIEKIAGNMQEIKARGGEIIAITSEGNDQIASLAKFVICVPKTLDALMPIVSVIPLQLLAYHIAVKRGCDVDKPRNLAKSVTVE